VGGTSQNVTIFGSGVTKKGFWGQEGAFNSQRSLLRAEDVHRPEAPEGSASGGQSDRRLANDAAGCLVATNQEALAGAFRTSEGVFPNCLWKDLAKLEESLKPTM
jgi:hypothetical protein